MAQFRAEIKGDRGEVSRQGNRLSGIMSRTASWQGSVDVRLRHDETTGLDMAVVQLLPWHGEGVSQILYDGPVGGWNRRNIQRFAETGS